MPCYDKKLEASRSDFYNEIYATRDVDCVITTGEMELLVHEKGWDLSLPVLNENVDLSSKAPLPGPVESWFPELIQHSGSSSGSYLQSIIDHLQRTSQTPLSLTVKQIRNADYEEFVLRRDTESDSEGEVVFKGAKCYGFRNLQNVVRKVGKETGVRIGVGAAGRLKGRAAVVKRGKRGEVVSEKGYDYIEVMACPGGCVNGGGQSKPPTNFGTTVDAEGFSRDWEESGAKWGNREWTKKVETAYWHDLPTPPASPVPSDEIHHHMTVSGEKEDTGDGAEIRNEIVMMADRLSIDIADELCRRLGLEQKVFRTNYRAVESEVIGLAVKW